MSRASECALGDEPSCADVERACEAGFVAACWRVTAIHHFAGRSARAEPFWVLGCERSAYLCWDMVLAGRELAAPGRPPGDAQLAARLFARACQARWPAACLELAELFGAGRGVPRDPEAQARSLALACFLDANPCGAVPPVPGHKDATLTICDRRSRAEGCAELAAFVVPGSPAEGALARRTEALRAQAAAEIAGELARTAGGEERR